MTGVEQYLNFRMDCLFPPETYREKINSKKNFMENQLATLKKFDRKEKKLFFFDELYIPEQIHSNMELRALSIM